MKRELKKLLKEYQEYIDYWNEKERANGDRPIPIGGNCYAPSFTGFMAWIGVSSFDKVVKPTLQLDL